MACVRKRRVGKGFRWVLDYRDQQQRRHWETTKGNRKEAERLLAERVRQISRGTYQAPNERVSFEDLAQAYLKHAEGNLRENTLRDYRCNVRLHLLPYLQGWKVRDIRRVQVEELRGKLLDSGVGAGTVNKCLTLLGAVLRYAMRHEWVEANPAEGTKLRASSRRSHDLVEANILAPFDGANAYDKALRVLLRDSRDSWHEYVEEEECPATAEGLADFIRDHLEPLCRSMESEVWKPKGMHWRTFERLTARHDKLVGKSLADMVQRLGLGQGRLDGLRRHLPAEG